MIDRIARRIAHAFLARIHTGRLTVVEDGETVVFGAGPPTATVYVHSPRVWRRLMRGSRGLAESYLDGMWTTPDLTAVVRVAARNVDGIDRLRRRLAPVRAPIQRAAALVRPNTRRRSRRAIAEHYDLGNDLFELMLDPTMMYSSALFDRPGMTLEEASTAKLERICEKLALGPDDHVLAIGTGWGGFAVHAASTRGCRVTTTTISREQHDYAVESVRRAGLEHRVTVLLDDYPDHQGRYDKLVSIEMIEAVGWRHFGTFFDTCSRLLEPDGLMMLQAILIDDRAYEVEKAGKSFINTYVFPDGCLPSMEVITRSVARRTDMQTLDVRDLTPDYAETLRRWSASFLQNAERAAALGYDERFKRLWTLYLSYCEAGFAERRITGAQVLFAKPQHRSTLPAGLGRAAIGMSSVADAG
ncbi:MAG TPA: cyclopropane-fatty-acyl-phospholipid synthase family protein [Gemmatimonadaceae bacterium]|nr:cyclopropane-fatty-acyl-phospholipid synthase family protein [Gemmatimonadaceae bacterium]